VAEFCFNIRRARLRRNYDVNIERAACVERNATCSVGINTEIVLRRRKTTEKLDRAAGSRDLPNTN
jgi:hypothetical protein